MDDYFELYDLKVEVTETERPMVCSHRLGDYFLVEGENLVFCGINVFAIIFTVYPIACAFFKVGDIPRNLIPACVLGACVSQQVLPGVTTTANVLTTETFGVPAAAGPVTGIVLSVFLFVMNAGYLYLQGKKARERGEHFVPLEGESFDIDLDKKGLPHPALMVLPVGVVLIALNAFGIPAYASLYLGAIVAMVMSSGAWAAPAV